MILFSPLSQESRAQGPRFLSVFCYAIPGLTMISWYQTDARTIQSSHPILVSWKERVKKGMVTMEVAIRYFCLYAFS